MEPAHVPALDELAALVESRGADQPAAAQLRLAVEVGRELTETGDALIGRFVAQARAAGHSWTEIGELFGTSKQAAQQRYGAVRSEPGVWPGRWTAAARDALDRACDEARRLRHHHVGTEHVLVALASADQGVASEVLAGLGVTRERVLATSCMRLMSRDHEPPSPMTLMPRLKQSLEHSRRIADGLEVVPDTEHLLAGIVAVPDAMAVEILRRLKAGPDALRNALAERLQVEPERLDVPRRRRRRLITADTPRERRRRR